MIDLPLLVEVRYCLFPSFIAISTVYKQNVYLGEFIDGSSVMFKNITSYLGECRCGVCTCVFVLTCVSVNGGAVLFKGPMASYFMDALI